MVMSVAVPAIIISISAPAKAALEGLTTNLPSINATRASEIGPPKGISEIEIAALAANPANASGIMFSSCEIRLMITCTSEW